MNDAVESFLVFENARMTGQYREDYEGELEAELSVTEEPEESYVLVVHQGETVVTIFFEDLSEEVHLYDYGEIYLSEIPVLLTLVSALMLSSQSYDSDFLPHQVMQELAATVEDKKLLRCLKFYQKHPWKRSAKKIAGMLQEKRHAEVTDLLMEELKMAAANYPRRKFTDEEENQNRKTEKRASERKRELEEQGFRIKL